MVLVERATPGNCGAAAYRPKHVRFLLIAQTPPEDLDRYFYFRSVPVADYLFQAVVPHFLGERPARLDKRNQLSALRDLGVYMIDLKPDPCDPRDPSDFADDVVRRARRYRPDNAILIKVDVYDAAFRPLLNAGVPVVDIRMPFPSTGRQREFCRKFRAALKTGGWKSRKQCG